jgi:hypothetical protein
MSGRTAKELGEELQRLMSEHLEHLRNRTFGSVSEEEYRQQEARLGRIRELSADYLSALKRSQEES